MADDNCANPLLLGWIKQWLDQARERNSKGVTVYKKAYESMKACPIKFNHPTEAQQLNGIGPKLCERLTAKLQEHCQDFGLPMPKLPHAGRKRKSPEPGNDTGNAPAKRTRKPKTYVPALRSGPYAILLALATLEERSSTGVTKAQLIEAAQPHCDSSFTAPSDPTKFYTAWNSMKTLITKDLVYEHGRPLKKYLLTDQGRETARLIQNVSRPENTLSTGLQTVNSRNQLSDTDLDPLPDSLRGESARPEASSSRYQRDSSQRHVDNLEDFTYITDGSRPVSPEPMSSFIGANRPLKSASSTSTSPIPISSGDFTIELVLDVREIRTTKDRDYISNELIRRGVEPIVRSLELGDALWIAKFKEPNFLAKYGEEGDEIMLDWIVERKRLDDLVGSIKDGRFHEQKFRLRRSGIGNVVYLIEEFTVTDPSGVNAAKIQEMVASAITSTQVVNGYFVKKTKNLDDTIRYLARMTSLLRKKFHGSSEDPGSRFTGSSVSLIPTHSISSVSSYLETLNKLRSADNDSESIIYTTTFPTFSALSSKSDMLTLRDLFLKMLMCTRGVTADKALEIQRRWPTPRQFVEAFEAADTGGDQGVKKVEELVFSALGGLVGRKKVGKALSKKIAEVWGRQM